MSYMSLSTIIIIIANTILHSELRIHSQKKILGYIIISFKGEGTET